MPQIRISREQAQAFIDRHKQQFLDAYFAQMSPDEFSWDRTYLHVEVDENENGAGIQVYTSQPGAREYLRQRWPGAFRVSPMHVPLASMTLRRAYEYAKLPFVVKEHYEHAR